MRPVWCGAMEAIAPEVPHSDVDVARPVWVACWFGPSGSMTGTRLRSVMAA